jgi:glyoxylase-like metal-dependent hydrolase (beta-lactamase superfamily II)
MANLRLILSVLACVLVFPQLILGAEAKRTADIAERGLSTSDFPRLKQLVPNVYTYADLLNAGGIMLTTVSLIVVTEEGVVVVDGQDNLEQGRAMIAAIKGITSQPIKYVVIASDHSDHVGGNAAFKEAYPDVVFVSSPVSQKVLADNANPPTEVVADKRTLHLGNTEIQILNIGRGHTGGDLVAYLPESKVIFLGELYLRYVFPAMITAYPSEWVETIRKAQSMDVSWYVPGHGFVVDDAATMKMGLEEARKATEHVIQEAKRLHAAGFACETENNCPAAQHANWGPYSDWTLFPLQAPRALARVYMEIDGKLSN